MERVGCTIHGRRSRIMDGGTGLRL
jgi:hypothetical protein